MTPASPTRAVVRPPANSDEIAAFFSLAASTFIRDTPQSVAAADFRRYVLDGPAPDPASIRGAFRGGGYLGGYLIEERTLRVGQARLRAGCVGVVVTHPDHRRQGVATALMRDALHHARARGMVVLLLHGMADFYTPFGYADVFDATEHAVRRADALSAPPSPYRVRAATADDAPALIDLYDRHYGPHPGSFARDGATERFRIEFLTTLNREAYWQRDGLRFAPPVVTTDGNDRPRGCWIAPWGPLRAFGSEMAADDWPAVLALLQHHARQYEEGVELDRISWPLPPDSLAAALLADHFTVEQHVVSRPWTNWEACLVDPLALLRGMIPAWSERMRHRAPTWRGAIALEIERVTGTLRLGSEGMSVTEDADGDTPLIALTSRVLLPLLFGFRSVAWAAVQEGQRIPAELVPLLEALFPPLTPWIAPTDGC
jgi:predicted N-acetyltransferase YhbS